MPTRYDISRISGWQGNPDSGIHSGQQGSRALAFFASVIDTCRARNASAWDYLTAAITAGRQRLTMLPLPALPAGA